MANTRLELKPYKGCQITKINGYLYVSIDPKFGRCEAYSLKDIKKKIDEKIRIGKLCEIYVL